MACCASIVLAIFVAHVADNWENALVCQFCWGAQLDQSIAVLTRRVGLLNIIGGCWAVCPLLDLCFHITTYQTLFDATMPNPWRMVAALKTAIMRLGPIGLLPVIHFHAKGDVLVGPSERLTRYCPPRWGVSPTKLTWPCPCSLFLMSVSATIAVTGHLPNGGQFAPLETTWNFAGVFTEDVPMWKESWRTVFNDLKQVFEDRCDCP